MMSSDYYLPFGTHCQLVFVPHLGDVSEPGIILWPLAFTGSHNLFFYVHLTKYVSECLQKKWKEKLGKRRKEYSIDKKKTTILIKEGVQVGVYMFVCTCACCILVSLYPVTAHTKKKRKTKTKKQN